MGRISQANACFGFGIILWIQQPQEDPRTERAQRPPPLVPQPSPVPKSNHGAVQLPKDVSSTCLRLPISLCIRHCQIRQDNNDIPGKDFRNKSLRNWREATTEAAYPFAHFYHFSWNDMVKRYVWPAFLVSLGFVHCFQMLNIRAVLPHPASHLVIFSNFAVHYNWSNLYSPTVLVVIQ